jgi:COP9 signalosome complex subunit 1
VGYHDLGDFLYARGNTSGAFKAYVRARDYCTTTAQVVHMCLAVIRTSLELPTFTIHIPNFVQKAESALDAAPGGDAAAASTSASALPASGAVHSQLRVASALALLTEKKYASVARRLGEVAPDLGVSDLGDLGMSPADVATLGALCALASLDRSALRAVVVDNVSFRTYLDACPDIRDLVLAFHSARYGACLASVDKLRASWKLDAHLREHVDTLCEDIKAKALAAYVAPYSRLRLSDMAAALQLPPQDVTAQLAQLIQEGVVAARIDRGAGVVHATRSDARTQAFTATMATATAYIRDTKALLLRASLMQNEVAFAGTAHRGGGHRGGGGGHDEDFDGGTFSPAKTAHGRFDDRGWFGRDRPRARGGARAEMESRRD